MNLKSIKWTNKDITNFRNFLYENKNSDEKIIRRKMITKTNLEVLAIYQKDIKRITKELLENTAFMNYLTHTDFLYYEETLIYGNVIAVINDFDQFADYLNELSSKTDNWATCDNLNFNLMYKLNKENLFKLSVQYINDNYPFKRRIGLLILFAYINDQQYEKEIYNLLDSLINEEHYYVNMAASWLLCELFVKSREQTLDYYKNQQTNKFIINKSIAKCRDSFRVSDEDKMMLLKYKQ